MLSYNLNTTLNSYVSEQAYLPFRLPESGWVCRVGSSSSLIVIRCVENGIHCLFYRITDYSRLLFRLKHPFYKCSMLLLFFKEIAHIISDLLNFLLRELENHLINIRYFHSLHIEMIKNKRYYVNTKNRGKNYAI